MSVELMDCFRMISSKVKEAGADEVSFDELASILKELLSVLFVFIIH